MGLNGHRADNMKRTLLDFSFSLSKRQKLVTALAQENEVEVVSLENDSLKVLFFFFFGGGALGHLL